MDESFEDLDFRLSVSGMVTDSFMTGIMNSVMQESDENAELERLDEKSRFYEMAILELQRCLRFEQEELKRYIVESSRQRERLIMDLNEMKDRIERRLEENEVLIGEKDRELREIREVLEMRDEEVDLLRAALNMERLRSERCRALFLCDRVSRDEDGVDGFCELKNDVDRQLWDIEEKLEGGKTHVVKEMCQTKFQNLSEFVVDDNKVNFHVKSNETTNDGLRGMGFCEVDRNSETEFQSPRWTDIRKLTCPTDEITFTFDQMSIDIDILKETLELVFEKADNVISLFKMRLMEHQWEGSIEREIISIVFRMFVEDLRRNYEAKVQDLSMTQIALAFSGEQWYEMVEAVSGLRSELDLLVTQSDLPPKAISRSVSGDQGSASRVKFKEKPSLGRSSSTSASLEGDYDAGSNDASIEESGSPAHLSKEDLAGHSVAAIIKSHESIIQKKAKEAQWLKVDIFGEKGFSSLKKDKDFDSMRSRIVDVIQKLDIVMQQNPKLFATPHDHRHVCENDKFSPQNLSSQSIMTEKTSKAINTPLRISDKWTDALDCSSPELNSYEGIRQLTQEIEELNLQAIIMEGTYEILFKGLAEDLRLKLKDNEIENKIRGDVYNIAFEQMAQNWIDDIESHKMESRIREEIYQITFSEFIKDVASLSDCPKASNEQIFLKDLPSVNHFERYLELIEQDDLMMELGPLSELIRDDVLTLDYGSKSIEQEMNLGSFCPELEELNEQNINHDGTLIERNNALGLANSRLEKALQQKILKNVQLRELLCDFSISGDDLDEAHSDVNPPDRDHTLYFPIENGEKQQNALEFVATSLDGLEVAHGDMTIPDRYHALCLPREHGQEQQNALKSLATSIVDFSKVVTDFERVIYEKVAVNSSRLEEIRRQLDLFIQNACSLRKKEMVYRTGFKRRCCDLLKAEAEVDLLGDEVDMLLNLLEKTSIALDHYSPVLQHYAGITDLQKLIRRELKGQTALSAQH